MKIVVLFFTKFNKSKHIVNIQNMQRFLNFFVNQIINIINKTSTIISCRSAAFWHKIKHKMIYPIKVFLCNLIISIISDSIETWHRFRGGFRLLYSRFWYRDGFILFYYPSISTKPLEARAASA